ncbi:hypothetical protein [Anatilimnocola floriformis]|uniref:hypothetical protein n=1 Tax=Anatilimnocola floriformis TaxID=2948575 RepID=UPI0020C46B04|nr:hypothetical protein [Anatilimnocola floriformis]
MKLDSVKTGGVRRSTMKAVKEFLAKADGREFASDDRRSSQSEQSTNRWRVIFSLHIEHKEGNASFDRQESVEFAPFVGLTLLDDAVGEFTLMKVCWDSLAKAFYCHAQLNRKQMRLSDVVQQLRRSSWVEDIDSRQPIYDFRDEAENLQRQAELEQFRAGNGLNKPALKSSEFHGEGYGTT